MIQGLKARAPSSRNWTFASTSLQRRVGRTPNYVSCSCAYHQAGHRLAGIKQPSARRQAKQCQQQRCKN